MGPIERLCSRGVRYARHCLYLWLAILCFPRISARLAFPMDPAEVPSSIVPFDLSLPLRTTSPRSITD